VSYREELFQFAWKRKERIIKTCKGRSEKGVTSIKRRKILLSSPQRYSRRGLLATFKSIREGRADLTPTEKNLSEIKGSRSRGGVVRGGGLLQQVDQYLWKGQLRKRDSRQRRKRNRVWGIPKGKAEAPYHQKSLLILQRIAEMGV